MNRKISVAPMMDCTDRHERFFLRLISKNTLLYTEMIVDEAIKRGNKRKLLEFNINEKPVALQLGGSSPKLLAEADEDIGDDFESLYKGEISKSGTPILPSKRARKAPEKIQVSKEDLAELSQTEQPNVENPVTEENQEDQGDVSLEEVSESENKNTEEANTENS